MIAIIDYGMGNLRSVENALIKLKANYVITNDIQIIKDADKLILPGVGAFGDCMKNLYEQGLVEVLNKEVLHKKKPLLGICLGMQVLFESSEEGRHTEGLGYLKGKVILMADHTVKISHIGWNQLEFYEDEMKKILGDEAYVYFVHSYYAEDVDDSDLSAVSYYGNMKLCALVHHKNILGAQFHPEKSGETGLKLLHYFVEEMI